MFHRIAPHHLVDLNKVVRIQIVDVKATENLALHIQYRGPQEALVYLETHKSERKVLTDIVAGIATKVPSLLQFSDGQLINGRDIESMWIVDVKGTGGKALEVRLCHPTSKTLYLKSSAAAGEPPTDLHGIIDLFDGQDIL